MKPEYKNILQAMQTLDQARWDLGNALGPCVERLIQPVRLRWSW